MGSPTFYIALATTLMVIVSALEPCPGDTRGDKRCNFDDTHRVCAVIGDPNTSFWRFTGQQSWCQTRGGYHGSSGNDLRCPSKKPTWCICKWTTASWIKGQGCDDTIQFNCEATDVCDVKKSYSDYGYNMKPAHDCMAKKCRVQWHACITVAPYSSCRDRFAEDCPRWARRGYCNRPYPSWMGNNCSKSCGKCVVAPYSICKDRFAEDCPRWARRGYCNRPFPSWMGNNCSKSCGRCVVAPYSICKDRFAKDCPRWARRGYCNRPYPSWMGNNCSKSCGRCSS